MTAIPPFKFVFNVACSQHPEQYIEVFLSVDFGSVNYSTMSEIRINDERQYPQGGLTDRGLYGRRNPTGAPAIAGWAADKYSLLVPLFMQAGCAVIAAALALFLTETAPSRLAQRAAPAMAG
jgi:hypothetical protein